MSPWDKGIDYEYAYKRIVRFISRSKSSSSLCNNAVLLVQLRNGSRISEAVRAFLQWIENGKREQIVRLSKRKNAQRLMIIPSEIDDKVREKCVHLVDVDEKRIISRVKTYSIRAHKFNTHSIRYAFITYLLSRGVESALVSKMIGHTKLDTLLRYVQQKRAEELLRELA